MLVSQSEIPPGLSLTCIGRSYPSCFLHRRGFFFLGHIFFIHEWGEGICYVSVSKVFSDNSIYYLKSSDCLSDILTFFDFQVLVFNIWVSWRLWSL